MPDLFSLGDPDALMTIRDLATFLLRVIAVVGLEVAAFHQHQAPMAAFHTILSDRSGIHQNHSSFFFTGSGVFS